MNGKSLVIILFVFILTHQTKAQRGNTNYFSAPLDTPLILVGTFGEIRQDHFHSGIDLSTGESEGMPVYAAANGYISRIKVSADGFGRVLYVAHSNGMLTVYAHLSRFRDDLQKYATEAEYEKKSYDVDLTPKPNEFMVTKGENIAWSGSSGDVAGPHLHFEVRDAATEEPINPLHFGFDIEDTVPPFMSFLRIFPVPGQGILSETDTAITYRLGRKADGNAKTILRYYPVAPGGIRLYGKIGFGIQATDSIQNSSATLGIYSLQVKIDSLPAFDFKMDRFSFSDTRYSNAHIDYLSKIRDDQTIQRGFRLPGNQLKIYTEDAMHGYVNFTDNAMHKIEFTVKDFQGNTAYLSFLVQSDSNLVTAPYQPVESNALLLTNAKGISLHKSGIEITIPDGSLYENYQFVTSESDLTKNMICPVYRVGDRFVPLHTAMTIGIKPNHLPDSMKSKAAIVSVDPDGNYTFEGGNWNGRFLTAAVKHFGDFTIAVDTTAPVIIKEYYPEDLNTSRGAVVEFSVTDNLSGIKSYEATVDGKWILTEYQKKTNKLILDLSALPANNKHTVDVKVTDGRGNASTFTGSFYF